MLSAFPLSFVPFGVASLAVEIVVTVVLRHAAWIDTTPLFALVTTTPTFTEIT